MPRANLQLNVPALAGLSLDPQQLAGHLRNDPFWWMDDKYLRTLSAVRELIATELGVGTDDIVITGGIPSPTSMGHDVAELVINNTNIVTKLLKPGSQEPDRQMVEQVALQIGAQIHDVIRSIYFPAEPFTVGVDIVLAAPGSVYRSHTSPVE